MNGGVKVRRRRKGAHLILIRLLLQSGVINKVGRTEGRKHPHPSLSKILGVRGMKRFERAISCILARESCNFKCRQEKKR